MTDALVKQGYGHEDYLPGGIGIQHDNNNDFDDILLSILSSSEEEANNMFSTAMSTATFPAQLFPSNKNPYEYQFFLTPTSWHVADAGRRSLPRPSWKMSHLHGSVQQVLRWVKQWVDDGSNAFIHKHLWGHDTGSAMPKCMQDAYTACAAYFGCTERNRGMMLRIIEDRVRMLLDEQQDESESSEWFWQSSSSSSTGKGGRGATGGKGVVAEHLARVQALLAYQVLRLLSGDARQRSMAEELFPTLRRWSMQMLECALLSSQYVQQQQLISSSDGMVTVNTAPAAQKRESEWQAWILAESVRRTWLVAGHTQCIYGLLRNGISACPGGLMFTTRAGLWRADSAEEWWETCWQKDVLFCQSLETQTQLVKKARPDEVDDFGMFVLRIVSEKEEVERVWADSPESV